MPETNPTPVLLTETEVSKHLRVSLAALRKWRVMRRGPRFIKIGSLVRYRPADVEEWLTALPAGGGTCQSTVETSSLRTDNKRDDARTLPVAWARARG
jgi:predicted DNA-binding transcriptional regulator AlpA